MFLKNSIEDSWSPPVRCTHFYRKLYEDPDDPTRETDVVIIGPSESDKYTGDESFITLGPSPIPITDGQDVEAMEYHELIMVRKLPHITYTYLRYILLER